MTKAMHDEEISKTRRKQAMHALQELGEQLVALSAERLNELDLPENLLQAVLEARRINGHEALRRQMQYIGKLMRGVDAAPIRDKLDAWRNVTREQVVLLHRIEDWRARLLEDELALHELAQAYPAADTQRLRVLLGDARREKLAGRPPKSHRALFRELRAILAG